MLLKRNILYASIFILIFLFGCATTKDTSQIRSEDVVAPTVVAPTSDESANEAKVSEFILGPGDKIEIMVYRHDDLHRTIQIDSSGKITFPLVKDIQAGGGSIFQLRDKIQEGLSKYIIDPQVSVGVVSFQAQKVIVLGEVKNPGYFQMETTLTALDLISQAGGFTLDGKQKNVLLIRGDIKKPKLSVLNLEKALREGDLSQNVILQRGDIIYVPRTTISNVNRFFTHLSTIISPIVSLESGYYIGQSIELRNSGGAVSGVSVPAQ